MSNILTKALVLVNRRTRLCNKAPVCPKCNTKQIQLINSNLLAKWKCRFCKHVFIHEPLTKSN